MMLYQLLASSEVRLHPSTYMDGPSFVYKLCIRSAITFVLAGDLKLHEAVMLFMNQTMEDLPRI